MATDTCPFPTTVSLKGNPTFELSSFYSLWAMAEILCEVGKGGEVVEACKGREKAARRRRLEIRRCRVRMASGDVGTRRKRRKVVELKGDVCCAVLKERLEEGDACGRCPKYGMTSVCGRRRVMEDAVSAMPFVTRDGVGSGFHYFGVFDGHGCSHVALFCKDRMQEVVAEELRSVTLRQPEMEQWKGVMNRSFTRVDAEVVKWPHAASERKLDCGCELQASKCDHVGSTAVVAVVSDEQIVVANCGDSRAVLCRGGISFPLSEDHKPDRPDELRRIQEAGGRVIYWEGARVLGVLAMSRAIGDNHLKPYVIPDPDVTVTERTGEDEFLILASDGLWDVVSNATACAVARMCMKAGSKVSATAEIDEESNSRSRGQSEKACFRAAILLTELAMARGTTDNVTVVVVDLRRR